jgi:hypothetical protein
MTTTEISERSRGITLVLAGLLGWVGGHRFYTGKVATGVLMALTLGGCGIWWAYDLILVAMGGFRDVEDRRVVSWGEGELAAARGPGLSRAQAELIFEELDALRGEVGDLGERIDFMERVLAQVKDRTALPPPEA